MGTDGSEWQRPCLHRNTRESGLSYWMMRLAGQMLKSVPKAKWLWIPNDEENCGNDYLSELEGL